LPQQYQAQAPKQIERVVEKVKSSTITLDPRDLEMLTAATSRRLLHRVYRSQRPQEVVEEFIGEANAIVNEVVFITYLAGMKTAGRDFQIDHISPSEQDWLKIRQFRQKYCADVSALIQDMVTDATIDRKVDLEYYHARSNMLVQMAVWTVYNQAKLAVYRIINKPVDLTRAYEPPVFMAANYKYKGYFMFKTAADETVCDLCAPCAGDLQEDPDLLEQPPVHVWCRCEIIAIPTVTTLEEQTDFLESWTEEG